jgi:hypothetical protein
MNLWKIFRKNPQELFFDFNPQESHWRTVSWNFDLDDKTRRSWKIEIHGSKIFNIQWKIKSHDELYFLDGKKIILMEQITQKNGNLRDLMNLSIHSTVKYGIEKNYEFILAPVSEGTAGDVQTEMKSLLWIQASFGTLSRALENVKNKSDLLLTASFFSGIVPDTKEDVLRLIAFNLDIFYYFRPDKTLQIVVFDDKDNGHGKSKTPVFQQIIKVTKPQFYDEITKLLFQIAQVGEIL